MKKRWLAALAALVLATAAFAEKTNFPSYLEIKGTKVKGYTGGLPEDLVILDGVKEIDDGVFRDCTSLKSVTIPSGVKKIGDEVFYGCKSLVSVTIPSSVKQISEGGWSLGDMSWIPGPSIAAHRSRKYNLVALWRSGRQSEGATN